MTEEERIKEIWEAIDQLVKKDVYPSQRKIREVLGAKRGRASFGDPATIGRAKKMWEEAQPQQAQGGQNQEGAPTAEEKPDLEIADGVLTAIKGWAQAELQKLEDEKQARIKELEAEVSAKVDDLEEVLVHTERLKRQVAEQEELIDQLRQSLAKADGQITEQIARIEAQDKRIDELIQGKKKTQQPKTAEATTEQPKEGKKGKGSGRGKTEPESLSLLEQTQPG